MGWIFADRLPKPDRYNVLAQTIWEHRHGLRVERVPGRDGDHGWTRVILSSSLRMSVQDVTGNVQINSGGHTESCGYSSYRWNCPREVLGDAWRAAQTARMLRCLGLSDEIPGDRLDVRPAPSDFSVWAMTGSSKYRGSPTVVLLADRLDRAASKAILEFSPEADSTTISIGDGLIAHRSYRDGILEHPDHGITDRDRSTGCMWRTAKAFRELRDRSLVNAIAVAPALPAPAMPALGNARETRMLQLCAVAVQRDPMLTDASGTLLAPLITRHVPELVERHREASRHALPQDLERIDEEFSSGMEVVCSAIEEGLSAIRDKAHDDLRTQISFLRSRHPRHIEAVSKPPRLEVA
jgi:hypothetical protein